jgi:hypothetical protein
VRLGIFDTWQLQTAISDKFNDKQTQEFTMLGQLRTGNENKPESVGVKKSRIDSARIRD